MSVNKIAASAEKKRRQVKHITVSSNGKIVVHPRSFFILARIISTAEETDYSRTSSVFTTYLYTVYYSVFSMFNITMVSW